jgi:hypothetical protein
MASGPAGTGSVRDADFRSGETRKVAMDYAAVAGKRSNPRANNIHFHVAFGPGNVGILLSKI